MRSSFGAPAQHPPTTRYTRTFQKRIHICATRRAGARWSTQKVERGPIRSALEVSFQCPGENAVPVDRVEQRETGAELHVVGTAEDIVRGPAFDREYQFDAFDEPRSQNGVIEKGARLFDRSDCIMLRHRAPAEASELREDEPHPVARLAAQAKLVAHSADHRLLRNEEAVEVIGISRSHARTSPPRHLTPSASAKNAVRRR